MRFLPFVLVLAACNASPSAPAPVKKTMGVTAVGEPVPAGTAIPVATVIAKPEDYTGKPVIVEGRVRAACKKRGCWMELAGKDGGPACRVRFKDYGFFVPTDSAGADARLSGEVVVKTIAKDDVAHYESEGAKFDKAADGSAKVVEITATGVELVRL